MCRVFAMGASERLVLLMRACSLGACVLLQVASEQTRTNERTNESANNSLGQRTELKWKPKEAGPSVKLPAEQSRLESPVADRRSPVASGQSRAASCELRAPKCCAQNSSCSSWSAVSSQLSWAILEATSNGAAACNKHAPQLPISGSSRGQPKFHRTWPRLQLEQVFVIFDSLKAAAT